ncbi:hypothetical protein C8F04DRAFT_1257471 [Mycena alexandri]|uniref:Uncharacterized protein n=1 Tax=Mycena alexandri TaxID=1745969 RepID=A0AAD6SZZ1_9AGAR|nr:hypothetical protein C8F04DRAFT_1257471 [Mycena alexandri]
MSNNISNDFVDHGAPSAYTEIANINDSDAVLPGSVEGGPPPPYTVLPDTPQVPTTPPPMYTALTHPSPAAGSTTTTPALSRILGSVRAFFRSAMRAVFPAPVYDEVYPMTRVLDRQRKKKSF